ncbi:RibD family protein [Rhizobium ruizarguesonis]|uniref:RibD family protein n=1 Tax=Rhizobium ruizarguesonis TaxID=2081791 RepID=UPI001031D0D0|nr:dihydrofolate reductase family protein [Rhizobium ruizarguesonis]TBE87740.1 riboflavin deaminase [Rhizobium ruizarguesonis]
MKPYIACLMLTSPDGSLHPSRWTKSPDGDRSDFSKLCEKVREGLQCQAWMVGRVTMAEMSKAGPHTPAGPYNVERPSHFANREAKSFGIALDRSGAVHYKSAELFGDHIIALLGKDVPDSYLAELIGDGVSYLVAEKTDFDVGEMLAVLNTELGISRIVLEGGAATNGTLLASGLVDELNFIVAPALEARSGTDSVVEFGTEGLAGKVELSLIECQQLGHGTVNLRYAATQSLGTDVAAAGVIRGGR